MTQSVPPRLAPPGTPECIVHFLDTAAAYLGRVVEKDSLDLKPYDLIMPDEGTWAHHLYGTVWDRDFAIQIAANDQDAPEFHAVISGFVRIVVNGNSDHWLRIDCRRVTGMYDLMKCVKDLILVVRIACALRMPHVCEPDGKA